MSIKTIFTLLIFGFISSCSSVPKGRNVLEEEFIKNATTPEPELKKNEFVNSGRPIYVEGIAYPQMIDGGHVSLEGKVAIYIGRESIKLNKILDIETDALEKEFEEVSKQDNEKK